jgi:hypothetical protein
VCKDLPSLYEQLSEEDGARLTRWWLRRYSLEELLEIGELLAWPSVPE